MAGFEEGMAMLNDAQREAVETIDGPLLVVAGPGTGKTQLLSLRAANILRNRDVQPYNVLCLTYTDAGARAMRSRLIELIGRDAYGIEVSTFHSFASSVKTRYPRHFPGAGRAVPVSELHAQEIIDSLLKGLPFGSPLSSVYQGKASSLRDVASFIGTLKRNGLKPEEYRRIMRQNIAYADYLEAHEDLMEGFATALPRKKDEKIALVNAFEEELLAVCHQAPRELGEYVIGAPGIYVPYARWLADLVNRTQLVDEGGKTTGFQQVRDVVTKKSAAGGRVASVREESERGLIAADVYERYQEALEREGLVDFDDMIMEFIEGVEGNEELRTELQERYQYIQVDEFQDTNGAQMRIVSLLCEGKECPNVMAVGDDDQAIMRFQGASIACIGQFQELFCPKNVVLKVNYRSTPAVVELGKGIAKQVEHRLPASALGKDIAAHREDGEQVSFNEQVFTSKELEYQALAQSIRERIDSGFIERAKNPNEAIAVIASKHSSLRALIPYLHAENIPFSYKESSNLFTMESMQTLLALLKCVTDLSAGRAERASAYLPQIIAAKELGGTPESAVGFALWARREHYGDWLGAMRETKDARIQGLYGRLVEWAGAAPAAPVRELLFSIAGPCMAYYRKTSGADPLAFAKFNGGIRALLDFARTEIGDAAATGRTMKLPDVVNRLLCAQAFGVAVNAEIELKAEGAVCLTTAHSSKGLEYDLVYLLDADDATWHTTMRPGGLYAKNVLIGDEKDDDDARRLLFVAVTRAKSYLELYRAGNETLRELQGSIGRADAEPTAGELASALETNWRDSYKLDTPEMAALLAPSLPPRSLSASALNAFVEYHDGEPGGEAFPNRYLLRLPEPPAIALEFGNIVHAFLEEYVNQTVKECKANAAGLAAEYRAQVERLDFAPEEVQTYASRFDRIVQSFIPWVGDLLEGRLETEVPLEAIVGENVPLFGYCDLLMVDDASKTIRVADYKTGFHYPEGRPDPAYERQLQFYRLLIEGSAEYRGYTVVSCENWYVEPDKESGEVREPKVAQVSDEDVARLERLVQASWNRIARGDFDTSAFERSERKVEALGEIQNLGSRPKKADVERILQRAYEDWLIAEL